MLSIRGLVSLTLLFAVIFAPLSLMKAVSPAEPKSRAEATPSPAARPHPQTERVARQDLDEPQCDEFASLSVTVSSHDVAASPWAFATSGTPGCAVEMIARGKAASTDALQKPATACTFTATRSDDETRESANKEGLALDVSGNGDCEGATVDVTIHLNPTLDAKAAPVRGATASFDPWAWRAVKAKITGQDAPNIDMFWSWIRVYWWYDGYSVSDGSRTTGTGDNIFWGLGYQGTYSVWSANTLVPNRYELYQQTYWHSCGFPTCANVNVDAQTRPTLRAYYNGTASCQYSHSYDAGELFYPDLDFLDECWWDM